MDAIQQAKPETELRTLIDELLDEQQSLTAVERFSKAHARDAGPIEQKIYRDLLPLNSPAPGEQYAFEVDLDKCSGCKACVTACHALNGLEEEESWREVGLLHSDDWRAPFQANVTTACHHCVEPGCLSGCPVLAYDKDPTTGIVRHLDDQCIGCQYCVMKCPYDVPKYSARLGIIRKCDMCSNRLSHGEAPACAQACPSQAIRIAVINQDEISARFNETDANLFLPGTPPPQLTYPTTRYISKQPLPASLLAGDHGRIAPADAHLSLVFMLVFSQLSVGASVASALGFSNGWTAVVAFATVTIALACGILHLGQPLKAWRCFLGWRTSWFSREVIAFGVFLPFSALNAASWWFASLTAFQKPIAWLAAATGIAAVGCSAMIYADTHRKFWRASQSFGKFFGSTVLLGCATVLAMTSMFHRESKDLAIPATLACVVTLLKLAMEQRIFRHWVDEETPMQTSLNKSARLLDAQLGKVTRARLACGVLGGVVLPFVVASEPGVWMAFAMFALCVSGELMERYLFFAAVAPEKMPGGVPA